MKKATKRKAGKDGESTGFHRKKPQLIRVVYPKRHVTDCYRDWKQIRKKRRRFTRAQNVISRRKGKISECYHFIDDLCF